MSPRDAKMLQAASLADSAGRALQRARVASPDPKDQLQFARMAWTAHAQYCRAMAELEPMMPRSVEAGYDFADRAREIAESAAARKEIA